MITRVSVKNFRSLGDVDVNVDRLTVLVGPNASGKSNFIDALRFVRDSLRRGLDNAITERGGLSAIRRWSPYRPYKTVEFRIEGREKQKAWQYQLVIGSDTPDSYQIVREFCEVQGRKDRKDGFDVQNGVWKWSSQDTRFPLGPETLALRLLSGWPAFSQVYSSLVRAGYYVIFPNILREPQKPGTTYPLDEHGANLASVLRSMIKKKNKFLPDLQSTLSRVVPGISDVRVRAVGGYLVVELRHESYGEKEHFFAAGQESDGTLRILGLLVALFQTPTLSLLGVEEPELTIHPGAMGVLCDMFREASVRGQIMLTTHSPDLISRFSPEELRVVERESGVTGIGPVDKTQLRAVRERLFSAGELMRIEGLRRSRE